MDDLDYVQDNDYDDNFDYPDDYEDDVTEAQEWHDFDPDC